MFDSGATRIGISTVTSTTFARRGVGRIVEIHVGSLAGTADVERLNDEVFAAVRAIGPGAVICADFRNAAPMRGEVAGRWSTGMRKANGSIARSALLLDSSNTLFNLQIERIVRCAGNDQRRMFVDAHELRRWLDGALTEIEREAIQTVFSRPGGRDSGGRSNLV